MHGQYKKIATEIFNLCNLQSWSVWKIYLRPRGRT